MRRNELTIVAVLVAVALMVGFWILILGPKRQEASSLNSDNDQLQGQVAEAQQAAAAGDQARKSFATDYRKLVVLGKAVPTDGDQASLLVQLQSLADSSGVSFETLDLNSGSSGAVGTTATPAPSTSTDSSSASTTASASTSSAPPTSTDSTTSADPTTSADTSATTAVATEAAAAALPIGASIGPAGLPVMNYEMTFSGGFFQIADFFRRVDELVGTKHGAVVVDGRLLTVDSFSLSPIVEDGKSDQQPKLTADLNVTTYLTPVDQGATAGASPTGPAPTVPGAVTPSTTSTTAPSTTAAPTATPTSSTTP